ncbi:hypothetical protein FXV83_15850 [Bradyrhizobium hipponense]|uniref:DUF2188 domain-containing protein n=1 Tax=Bradyrhizobium hipponense TaxID=2605638 RepID=A0A5S4YMR2_9BRAD|nr:hypothetical protein [Bradyrhizobium hipponense]TYO65408.1 hypothetical protein FXV83_15850 [Bradyrhizobium hipponense]
MSEAEPQGSTIIHHHPGCDAYDAGWYIVWLEPDGTSFDTIGPFDTDAEAARILEETSTE